VVLVVEDLQVLQPSQLVWELLFKEIMVEVEDHQLHLVAAAVAVQEL
jgi:hypothetical protein